MKAQRNHLQKNIIYYEPDPVLSGENIAVYSKQTSRPSKNIPPSTKNPKINKVSKIKSILLLETSKVIF